MGEDRFERLFLIIFLILLFIGLAIGTSMAQEISVRNYQDLIQQAGRGCALKVGKAKILPSQFDTHRLVWKATDKYYIFAVDAHHAGQKKSAMIAMEKENPSHCKIWHINQENQSEEKYTHPRYQDPDYTKILGWWNPDLKKRKSFLVFVDSTPGRDKSFHRLIITDQKKVIKRLDFGFSPNKAETDPMIAQQYKYCEASLRRPGRIAVHCKSPKWGDAPNYNLEIAEYCWKDSKLRACSVSSGRRVVSR